MRGTGTIYFIDADTIQNENSGLRERSITSIKDIRCEVGPVGATSFWQAQSQNIRLDISIYVKRISYNNEKYFYNPSTDSIYEFFNVGKGRTPADLSIYATELKDDNFKELVKNALGYS